MMQANAKLRGRREPGNRHQCHKTAQFHKTAFRPSWSSRGFSIKDPPDLNGMAQARVLDHCHPIGHFSLGRMQEHLRHLRQSERIVNDCCTTLVRPLRLVRPHRARLPSAVRSYKLCIKLCTRRASSAVANEVRSSAVRRVWRREETKIRTGFVGECDRIEANAGLFMAFMRGQ